MTPSCKTFLNSTLAIYSALTIALGLTSISATAHAGTNLDPQTREKILAAGVPEKSLNRILNFIDRNQGHDLQLKYYTCDSANGKPAPKVAPCDMKKRHEDTLSLPYQPSRYAAVVDMSLPSSQERLFVIDLEKGEVKKYFVTHGRGSGVGDYARTFSNLENSHQTSLGLYLVGPTYPGHYGETLRLYGLDSSNSNAYWRDIVMHGAWYAKPQVIDRLGRLGLSHGCPAVDPKLMKKLIPLLKNGALLDISYDVSI